MEKQKRKVKPDEVKILLRLDKDLKSDIEALSYSNERSINSEIIHAIKRYVKQNTL